MATQKWISADGNWGANGSWSGGAVPVNNDTVIFTGSSNVSVTSGLAQAAVDLDNLIIHPDYTGDVGTSGSHLTISSDRVVHEGAGTLYYTDGNGTTDRMIINSKATGDAAVLSGDTITRLTLAKGKTTLDSGFSGTVVTLELTYFTSAAGDVELISENGAGTITTLIMNGGKFSSHSTITTAHVAGGKLVQEQVAPAISNLYTYCNAQVVYNSDETIAMLHAIGGMVDFTQDANPVTVSDLRVWPGAQVYYSEDRVTVTAGGELYDKVIRGMMQ